MDGEQNVAQAQGEERQRQQSDPQADDEQQEPKALEQVGAPDDEEIRAALAKQIEELKAASDAERREFELCLAGAQRHRCRGPSRRARRRHDQAQGGRAVALLRRPRAGGLDRARTHRRREGH